MIANIVNIKGCFVAVLVESGHDVSDACATLYSLSQFAGIRKNFF